jgi:hypothetical protein
MKHARLAALAFVVALATSWLVSGPLQLLASQGSNFLDTTGVYSGLTAANRTNAALDALLTCNSGSSAPTNALGGVPKLGQCWIDTTSATLPIKKRYTGAAWVVEGVLDVTNGIWSPVIGGGIGTVASSGSTDLCASPQAVQNVTGTTTVTSFGSSCAVGQRKITIYGGILTLTYNSASLIIPGAASKTTANGDISEEIYLGSGNWRVLNYVPIGGVVVNAIDSKTGNFTTGGGITSTGGNVIQLALTNATLQTSPSSALSSTTGTPMAGLGSSCHITPVYSGRVKLAIIGSTANTTSAQTNSVLLRWGTGTAPTSGAAGTGTAVGAGQSATSPSAAALMPMVQEGIVTGQTLGVAIWFDISLAVNGGVGTLSSLSCNAMEF